MIGGLQPNQGWRFMACNVCSWRAVEEGTPYRCIKGKCGSRHASPRFCLSDTRGGMASQLTAIGKNASGGATLMAHIAREREQVSTESLDQVMNHLSWIFVEYEAVLPFSRARETRDSDLPLGGMEGLARELVLLSWGDETGLDCVYY